MSFLRNIRLNQFRSYASAHMDDVAPGMIVITGANGAGKTNILEAVSILSPGRGLRGAGVEELQQQGAEAGWTVSGAVDTGGAEVVIGTGLDPVTAKRVIRINGVPAKSQSALGDYLACIWLTPQMDRIFIDSAGGRRRFFDKLVFAFDPSHSGRVTRYENALAQRSRLLKEGGADAAWLSSLEMQMAETGIAIAAARIDFIRRLQRACDGAGSAEAAHFPKARLALRGMLEERLLEMPAVEVEDAFLKNLALSRFRDGEAGGAGPHRTDIEVVYAEKAMPAAQCSTGEQKALLIGIVLAHARLLLAERGMPPILLLDEIAAHLDENRRGALFDLLETLGAQAWMTGTDEALFSALSGRAQFWSVARGAIQKSA